MRARGRGRPEKYLLLGRAESVASDDCHCGPALPDSGFARVESLDLQPLHRRGADRPPAAMVIVALGRGDARSRLAGRAMADSPQVLSKNMRIGGLTLLLRSNHAQFWKFADRRYQRFYTSETGRHDETVDHRVTFESTVVDALPRATSVVEDDGLLRMARGTGVATWDRHRHYTKVEQPVQDFSESAQHPDYVVDSAIRVMFSYRLLEQDGVLLHAAGMVKDGKGYLFAGESNAGKSTVARCSSKISTVLSDDLTIAYLTRQGGSIFGTPFFGEFSTGGTNVSAPLAGIYFLRKATANKLVPLDSNRTLTRFLKSVMFFGQDRATTAKVLQLATRFCQCVPCYELQFLPNDSFWRCLDVDSHSSSE